MGKLILAEGPAPTIEDLYIMLPNGSYVREDYFDNLTDVEYAQLMNLLEPTTMSENEYLSGRAEREARREARRAAKLEKIKAGGGLANLAKNVAKGAAAIFGGASPSFDDSAAAGAPDTRGLDFNVGVTTRKWYQNPAVIIGGAAVLGIGIYLATRKKK